MDKMTKIGLIAFVSGVVINIAGRVVLKKAEKYEREVYAKYWPQGE